MAASRDADGSVQWRGGLHGPSQRIGASGAHTLASGQVAGKPLGDGEYELVFNLGLIDDGRYANNGWLQELPDPVSRLTWDNVLYMSPKTAAALDIKIETSNDNFSDLPNTDTNPRKTPRSASSRTSTC